MRAADLRDRKEFLLMQHSLLSGRLERYMDETDSAVQEITAALRDFSAEACDIEAYFLYRCDTFQTYCTELAESLANNLVLSKTRIDYNFFTNLLRVDYAFHVLRNRIELSGFKIHALVDINTGRVYFNRERNSSRLIETVPGKNLHAMARRPAPGELLDSKGPGRRKGISGTVSSSEMANANSADLNSGSAAMPEAPVHNNLPPPSKASPGPAPLSPAYDSISSLYKHSFPSMNFLTSDIPVCGFPHLQALFQKPFSINISIVEMNKYIIEKKVAVIFNKMETIKDMEVPGLLYLTSLEYYRKYMYSDLLPIAELSEPRFEREIDSFLADVPAPKKAPLLNLLLNLAPGLLYSVDLSKYSALPHGYLLSWVAQYLQR